MRCATCGEPIHDGDVALRDPDGMLYCGASCVADALAEEVIVTGQDEEPMDLGPTWTYEEATRLAAAYERLREELDRVERALMGAAQGLRAKGHRGLAEAFAQARNMLHRARLAAAMPEKEAPAGRMVL